MDTVGGFLLADGTHAKALTGIDDYSRFCVSARLMARERTRPVCDGLTVAMLAYGVPEQILTDNGRVFTGRFPSLRSRCCSTRSAGRTGSSIC